MVIKNSTDICMVVHNDVTHDARVRKEAATLAGQGWSVVVVGITRSGYHLPAVENVQGFTIIRVTLPKWYRYLSTNFKDLLFKSKFLNNKKHPEVTTKNRKISDLFFSFPLEFFKKLYRLIFRFYNLLFNQTGYIAIYVAVLSVLPYLRRVNARVYHGHDFPGLLQLALAGIWHRPIVYDSHELYFDQWSPNEPPGVFRYLRPWEKRLAKRTARIITVSEGIADNLEQILEMPRPLVIRNTTEIRQAKEAATIYPTKGHRTVVHSGSITVARHLPELVKSLAYLSDDIVLILMGDGQLKAELIEIAQKLDVAERLVIVPPVEPDCVAQTLAQADIGAVLITTENTHYDYSLPNKFFECIAAGLPLVVSPCKEIAELTKRYDMGEVCDPTEPAAIAQAILSVLEPENLATYKANVCKARDEVLNWEQEEQKLISLYKKILCAE